MLIDIAVVRYVLTSVTRSVVGTMLIAVVGTILIAVVGTSYGKVRSIDQIFQEDHIRIWQSRCMSRYVSHKI